MATAEGEGVGVVVAVLDVVCVADGEKLACGDSLAVGEVVAESVAVTVGKDDGTEEKDAEAEDRLLGVDTPLRDALGEAEADELVEGDEEGDEESDAEEDAAALWLGEAEPDVDALPDALADALDEGDGLVLTEG
jgi:hypothetical protein